MNFFEAEKMKLTHLLFCILVFSIIIGCSQPKEQIENKKTNIMGNMKLTSSAFANNGAISSEFTCDGADISPALVISDVPKNAKSLALIMDDPDAPIGTFVHWVVWNIPTDTKEIKKGDEPAGVQGTTGFKRSGYGGPCPPSGTHRYFFKLYALDILLDLPEGSNKNDLEKSMGSHIIEKTQLIGLYKRK